MSKSEKITLTLFILSAICWFVEIVINPSNFEFVLVIAAIILSLLFICFCGISIAERLNKNVSPYRVFAIVDSCIGVCTIVYDIYDIKTDTGWFAGLFGTLLLMFVVPISVALLVADFIIWKLKK